LYVCSILLVVHGHQLSGLATNEPLLAQDKLLFTSCSDLEANW
jgi:hypothetical protein